jgi:hypothetical protein
VTDRFEAILDESISALQAGVSLEEILAEVPEYAAELRPMLYAAMLLADPNPALVPEERKLALKQEYLAQVATLPPKHPTLSERMTAAIHIAKKRLTRKAVLSDLLTISITVVLTLMMAVAILTYTAQGSLPGDLLYGVKQATEQTRLLFTFDKNQHAQLREQFNQQRLDEINQLILLNRAAVVRFFGTLETKGENLWVIEGFPIFLPEDADIDKNVQEGDTVEVIGILKSNNVLVADTVRAVE